MTTNEYDSFGPIYIHPPAADGARSVAPAPTHANGEGPQNARRLRRFMRGARVATHLAFSAVFVSIPGSTYMDFDPSKSPPGWAVASFFVGLVGFMAILFLIPARIIGRIVLFVVGDGTSRTDAWLRLGFVVLVVAIATAGITWKAIESANQPRVFTSVTVAPTTIAIAP